MLKIKSLQTHIIVYVCLCDVDMFISAILCFLACDCEALWALCIKLCYINKQTNKHITAKDGALKSGGFSKMTLLNERKPSNVQP